MFDRERAIADWRARLQATGSLFEGDLDELESHLRDELDALEEVDLRGKAAFDHAEKRLGDVAALGLEFAKVNPLLVWRTALFWLTTGCFLTLVGAPLWELSMHGVMDAGLALHLPIWALKAALFAVILGVPPVAFGLLFRWMSSRIGKPYRPLQSPLMRVLLLVGGAVSMLTGHLHGLVVDNAEFRAWGPSEAHIAALNTWSYADWLLGLLAPIAAAGGAIYLRHRAMRLSARTDVMPSSIEAFRAREAPLFWLAVGCFIAIVRVELGTVVRGVSLALGGALHFGSSQIETLMWIVSFACPIALGLSAWTFLRFRAPSPRDLMRSGRFLIAVGVGCVAAIGGILTIEPVWVTTSTLIDLNTVVDALQAWKMANIFTALAIPVVIGTIMLRLERSAHGSHGRSVVHE